MQIVRIEHSETIMRNVYSRKIDPQQRYETGFVQIDNQYVPVWRSLGPEGRPWDDESHGAERIWRNVYVQRMHKIKDSKHITPCYTESQINNINITLPTVTLELASSFQNFIHNFNKRPKKLLVRKL